MVGRIAKVVGCTLGLLFIGVVVFVILGVTQKGSCGGTLSTGRTISASAHFCVSLECNKDTAKVQSLRRTIVVGPKKVLIDGVVVGSIEPTAKDIDVQVDWSGVTVTADGMPVNAEPIATASRAQQTVR